jgi:hypothetical protein
MTTQKKWMGRTAALAAVLTGAGLQAAKAANPAKLDIEVLVTSNLSVSVDGVAESTVTVTWDAANPSADLVNNTSSATVKNDSGAQTEKWQLSTLASSIDQGTNGSWSLATSTAPSLPGADQFALQAVFGSTSTTASGCPAGSAADWNAGYAAPLTTTVQTYTSTLFADPTLDVSGASSNPDNPAITSTGNNGDMLAGDSRALCWRIIAPSSISTVDDQTVQLVVTAANP